MQCHYSFYADDAALAMAHSQRERLINEAWSTSEASEAAQDKKGLGATWGKSANMLMSPDETKGGSYAKTQNPHKASAMKLLKKDKRMNSQNGQSQEGDEEAGQQELP